jgi:hypothetical protein
MGKITKQDKKGRYEAVAITASMSRSLASRDCALRINIEKGSGIKEFLRVRTHAWKEIHSIRV